MIFFLIGVKKDLLRMKRKQYTIKTYLVVLRKIINEGEIKEHQISNSDRVLYGLLEGLHPIDSMFLILNFRMFADIGKNMNCK